jgi:hypothetical protein
MLRTVVKVDIKTWKQFQQAIASAPSLTATGTNLVTRRLATEILRELRAAPARPRYPIQWTSEKQRRYVMAMLRRTNNLPYRRTGKLVRGWKSNKKIDVRGGIFAVENKVKYAGYVQGPFGSKAKAGEQRQQKFHRRSGWPSAPDVVARYRKKAMDALKGIWDDATVGAVVKQRKRGGR